MRSCPECGRYRFANQLLCYYCTKGLTTTHHLKTHPEQYQAVIDGRKKFEVRKDDRGFNEGDVLHLEEWDPETEDYTCRVGKFRVTYLLRGSAFGTIPKGVVIMSIESVAQG